MTLRTITFDDSIYKLVPLEPTDEMRKACSRDRYWCEIDKEWDAMIEAAPEYCDKSRYQEPEQICDDGGKCGAGGYCNNCAAPVVKENGKLRERLANQHAKIEQLRASLQECLDRAIGFLNDEIGVKPNELFDYNGWDERARNLLSQDIGKDE